jgi:hypothetical protein
MSSGAGSNGRVAEEEDAAQLRLGPGAASLGPVHHRSPRVALAAAAVAASHATIFFSPLTTLCGALFCADFGGKKARCLMNAEIALILEGKRDMMKQKGIQPKRCVPAARRLCSAAPPQCISLRRACYRGARRRGAHTHIPHRMPCTLTLASQ